MDRQGTVERKTRETDIHVKLNLDGTGEATILTGVPFLDHMLTVMVAHGFMDLELKAEGDTEIDDHHTVEDVGICFGMALKDSLGGMKGIRRFGEATVPLDESLARVVIDISNRPYLAYRVPLDKIRAGDFDVGLVKEFFRGLAMNAGLTLHVDLVAGEDPHHISEAIFKAFGRALDQASTAEPRLQGNLPSTKGFL